jgi:hypothetical protein
MPVPDGTLGNAWILGYRAPAQVSVCVCRVSNPSQALSKLSLQKSSSKDPTAMEKKCARSTVSPTHSRHDTAESYSQQSENILLLHVQLLLRSNNILHISFINFSLEILISLPIQC